MSDKFIPIYEPLIGEEELRNVIDCVKSGWISSIGEYITKFEKEFAAYCGVKYASATSNGTTALHLALHVLGIGKGDEVIVPALSFVATANAVRYVGAKPVFVDSENAYWCINPEKLEEKITARTKAIICVHLYGHPVEMALVMAVAKKNNLFVIEDAAEAHGAEYNGAKAGSMGDIGCFSFYGNKVITTGEGGMITTNNADVNAKVKYYRDQAMSKSRRYWHEDVGFNFRMTNIQAAIGLAQLSKIENIIEKKRNIAKLYIEALQDIKGVRLSSEASWARNVYWMFCVVCEAKNRNRDLLAEELKMAGIDTRPFFIPMHKLPPYLSLESLPVAENLAENGLNLPSSPLLTKEQITRICDAIKKIFRR